LPVTESAMWLRFRENAAFEELNSRGTGYKVRSYQVASANRFCDETNPELMLRSTVSFRAAKFRLARHTMAMDSQGPS
jgi:hypothetical protein